MNSSFPQSPEELEQFLEFIEEDIENVRRVIRFCREKDLNPEYMVHAKSETAEESAENVGIDQSKIVKTLIFRSGNDFVAVLCPGDRKVSVNKLEQLLGYEVSMASPSEVKTETGYVVGGVSPFDLDIDVLMEQTLLEKNKVKPASGSRVVGITVEPEKLRDVIEPEVADVTN